MERSSSDSFSDITLTKQNPLDRLHELCSEELATRYAYRFQTICHSKGFMCSLTITGPWATTLISKSRYVETNDITFAQTQLAAIVLDELGLGVAETTCSEESVCTEEEEQVEEAATNIVRNIARQGVEMLAHNNPELGELTGQLLNLLNENPM